jgi:hypothetical protein
VDSTPSTKSALKWIFKRNDWLMVFDNADGGYQVVEKFIPSGTVTEMGKEEAITLLSRSSMVDSDFEDVATDSVARKLIAALGCIPLAIDQAGAYIQSCGCGLDYCLANTMLN